MQTSTPPSFQLFCAPLIGLPTTHIWRGYGSAIFLEFGKLSHRKRLNGALGRNPQGEMGLMIEWSWRIEGKRRIWCGSWSEESRWERIFARLLNIQVTAASLVGRLPEIDLTFSNGLHVVSIMTAEGDPKWALFDRRGEQTNSLSVRARILRTDL